MTGSLASPRVTRGQIVSRGLSNRCPNCGHHSLFPPRSLRIHPECPDCGARLETGEGSFLGPWTLNYTVTVFLFIVPSIVLAVREVIPWSVGIGLAVFGCLGLPFLLYRASWSWWIMLYYYFSPEKLPANGGGTVTTLDD